jgi:hypothetical protein
MPLDPTIAALADAEPPPARPVEMAAFWTVLWTSTGVTRETFYAGLAASMLAPVSGYMPAPQRRNVAHRALRDGLRIRKLSDARNQKIKASARQWGHAC